MSQRCINIFLLAAVIVTSLVMLLHTWLPPRRMPVLPADQWSRALLQAYAPHEITSAYWEDESLEHFACKNKVMAGQYPVCALSIYFGEDYTKGVDLSAYNTLVLDADYFGDVSRLRVFVRNFNPDYSNVNDDNSAKYMSLTVATSELAVPRPLRIRFQEFSVAEWWLEQHEVERKYLPPEFTNITLLRLDFSEFLVNGNYLDLNINRIYFEGPYIDEKVLYKTLLLVWLAAAIAWLMYQLVNLLKRNRHYQQEIVQLAADRAYLSHKSRKYQSLSYRDPLTNLFNRLGMEEQMQTILADRSARPAGLVVMDIDHFKSINDQYGHDAGDSILKAVAGLLRANIRDEDILARWGGEEFVLITPKTTRDTAYKLAEKFRHIIESYTFETDKSIQITSSFGVTLIKEDESFELAFKRADKALYQAKKQGRNQSVLDLDTAN